jgi:hypothetical protein
MQSLDPKDRLKYASSSTPVNTAAPRKTYDYYVDPTVPTIEELRAQAEAEKQEKVDAVEGREEWAVNKEIAKVGEWETVAPPPAPPIQSEKSFNQTNTESGSMHDQAPQFQDDEEDEEDLHTFKIKEKELDIPINEEDDKKEEITFKKRKLGDSAIKSRKKKPLRKKE